MRFAILPLIVALVTAVPGHTQKYEKIGIPELEKILAAPDDILHVVNFWATWCPPCVNELPWFEKLSREYRDKPVKFILISLDFPSQIESRLVPFLEKNRITADVRVMTNLDYNSWIEKVDAGWQGNLPATLIFNNARKIRLFHAAELEEQELRELIIRYL